MKVGIAGASGYTGAELLRLLSLHPQFEVGVATAHSHAGRPVGGHTPSLRAAYPGLAYDDTTAGVLDGLDLVFCALPHGESQQFVPELRGRVGCIVDLAADFRLQNASLYPHLVRRGARRPRAAGRRRRTGCPSSSATGCAAPPSSPRPAAIRPPPGSRWRRSSRRGLVETRGIVVDAASGVSGAGRGPKEIAALRHRGRGLHRLRAAHPPAHARDGADPRRAGALHAAPGADGPGHPRHLLRRARIDRPAR